MANEKHVAAVMQRAHEALKTERARDPRFKLDLSGAGLERHDLQDIDLSNADLRNANLQDAKLMGTKLIGADLSGARATNANLTNANLSDADLTGANLSNANLTDVKVTPQTTLKANLQGAKISHKILREANVAGADLTAHALENIDLSGCDLRATVFNTAKLSGAKFIKSNLTKAQFSSSELMRANFTEAGLDQAVLTNADMWEAIFVGADLSWANLSDADLTSADITDTDLHETKLSGAKCHAVVGAYRARGLRTAVIKHHVHYFDRAVRAWPERWVDWEMIRVAGRLPLFGASYTALIVIPAYLYALEVFNDKVKAARAWIETSAVPAGASKAILNHLHEEPVPSRWTLLLVSTILLAAASTIYALACPSRVKSFSRDQWCDEHGHSLVHYWVDTWKMRPLRLACAAMYLLGGLGALYVLITKLWCAGAILLGSPSACF